MKNFKVVKNALAITLIFTLLFSYTQFIFAKDKKAVIVLPGLLASKLYAEKDFNVNGKKISKGQEVFPGAVGELGSLFDFNDINIKEINSLIETADDWGLIEWIPELLNNPFIEPIFEDIRDSIMAEYQIDKLINQQRILLDAITVDKDGTSKYPIGPNAAKDAYGVLDLYKPLVKKLEDKLKPKGYEVILFPWDWRLTTEDSTKALDKFVQKEGFSEIMLIGHSTGGRVISEFLALSDENIDLTSKVVFHDTVLAPDGFGFVTIDGESYVKDTIINLLPALKGNFNNILSLAKYIPQLKNLINEAADSFNSFTYPNNFIPSEQIFDLYKGSPVSINGNKQNDKLTYEESFELAKNNLITPLLRDSLRSLDATFYLDRNNKLQHISNKVDTLVFAGTGSRTTTKSVVTVNSKNQIIKVHGKDTKQGDGVLSEFVQTAGGTIAKKRVVSHKGLHLDMPSDKQVIEKTIDFILKK